MHENNGLKPIEILLIEDSPTDILMTEEALATAKMCNTLHVAKDGVAGMAFLRREGVYATAPRPDLILLDLNLPKKDGREVLAELKADADLGIIPVIVLTTSRDERDILKAYGLHANCYVTKPVGWVNFIEAIHSIETFWFAVVMLPHSETV